MFFFSSSSFPIAGTIDKCGICGGVNWRKTSVTDFFPHERNGSDIRGKLINNKRNAKETYAAKRRRVRARKARFGATENPDCLEYDANEESSTANAANAIR